MSFTPNFSMPMLHPAQAQKEITHNEALVLADALLRGAVKAMLNDPAPLAPAPGQAWIVGPAPIGAWVGQAGKIAICTDGGWRFATAPAGMQLRDDMAAVCRRFDGSAWSAYPPIAAPVGGSIVDAEARATLAAVLAALQQAGLASVT
ncbi:MULTISPECIES: DUF2793 domain-containing protein [Pseudomonadota]|jgi:hypothetical protein|uniref:DUF2793 domain-containing protein n=2 Tax=Pseudomonadota TaxID=1224 RepID=UPI00076A9290|nr:MULTISPECIES: DUF2793 domain-containing protein [Pseudomonadota]MAF61280.1 DUF2793 domain-containing protein [Blastomonas sp.]